MVQNGMKNESFTNGYKIVQTWSVSSSQNYEINNFINNNNLHISMLNKPQTSGYIYFYLYLLQVGKVIEGKRKIIKTFEQFCKSV